MGEIKGEKLGSLPDVGLEGKPMPEAVDKKEEDVYMEGPSGPMPSKGASKAEEIIEEGAPPVRRRKIKFGSAHLHLLKAATDADTQNWESLCGQ